MTPADEIERIFDTIKHDTDSMFSKGILLNCRYYASHPDMIEFQYKGVDYELKITKGSKVWDVDKPKTEKISGKEARKIFK